MMTMKLTTTSSNPGTPGTPHTLRTPGTPSISSTSSSGEEEFVCLTIPGYRSSLKGSHSGRILGISLYHIQPRAERNKCK